MFEPLTYLLLFGAGLLITLSPCILPVLPIMLGSGLSKDRFAPIKTGLGLAVGFALIGLLIIGLTQAIGLSPSQSKAFFAILIGLGGLALLAKELFAKASGPLHLIATRLDALAGRGENHKGGAFVLGLLLGGIWSPCVGPLLGAAIGLTAQQGTLAIAGLQMFTFGLGAATPLILVAYLAKGGARRFLPRIAQGGEVARRALGYILIGVSLYVLTGLDDRVLIWATNLLPQSWIDFTTRL